MPTMQVERHCQPTKTQSDGASPVSARPPKPKRSVRSSRQEDITTHIHTLTDAQRRDTSPPASDAKVSSHSNFLGTTGYLGVFRETPWWGSRISWNGSLQTEFEHWRTNQTYTCARLVRLICAVGFYRKHITWYYQRGRFTIIPAPLVLDSLSLVQEHVEKNAWNQEGNWKDIYERITATTSQPLEFSSDTSAEEFYSLYTGENLRWEFVGFMFALAGGSVQRRYKGNHVLDLGNGEEMVADTFTKEMVLATNACMEICRQLGHVNDLMIWMRHTYCLVGSEVLGETSERVYNVFGDIASNVYAMGLHRDHYSANVPFFLSETRKRVLAAIHKSDKNGATFRGRPPRLPYQYCDFALPLDLADDQLFLDEKSIRVALNGLDDEGWNSQGQFYPATIIRMRHIVTTLGEKMLGLSLGSRTMSYHQDLLETHQLCQQTWDRIPVRFRYSSDCWQQKDHLECLARAIVYLDFLSNVFQIQRIRRQEEPEATKDLLDTSMQLLSVIIDMIKQVQRHENIKQIPWILLIYGIPAAKVLVTEVHRHTVSNQPLPSSSSRSEIIRNLSFLISWVETSGMSPSVTGAACLELTKLIGRLLDEALNYQTPHFPPSSLVGATNLQEVDKLGLVTLAQSTVPAQITTDEAMNRSESQNQLQGLIDLGVGDDAFLGLGCGFASDRFNWLDEIELETDMGPWRL
ncbi:hypothetical protein UA08_03061 [Talaromyces atroroseus]|uniref:Transcription factor domain-containing protein n=1 Tax=Talaromyces atroroseus TaxID=1441469 RepID=A0A225AWN5_TALAT|nr:hypothetical protein UA08_03061 [Talaromyces atroroseus]OKL61728.1 hypothetical protein UA08_03061 [Talaromyces atroroseus]